MNEKSNTSASTSETPNEQMPMEVDIQKAPAVPFFNIESVKLAKVKQEFLIDWPIRGSNFVPKETKANCKVLKFSTDWTFGEAVKEISGLNPATFKNLYVFTINVMDMPGKKYSTSCDKVNFKESPNGNLEPGPKRRKIDVKEELQENFVRFCKSRQIVIQITSESDNEMKIFYNQESSMEVLREVKRVPEEDEQAGEFSSFFHLLSYFVNGINSTEAEMDSECCSSDGDDSQCFEDETEEDYKTDDENELNFESKIFNMLQNPDQLTLRFLTIFNLSLEFSFRVASYCAANFSKKHFFAALGAPFEDTTGNSINSKTICSIFEGQEYKSLLESAIHNEDREIFDYLIGYCCLFITRLPVDHQIEISNKLVKKNKVDMLCDLLESTDFLFPTDSANIEHARFQKIVEERTNFHKAIEDGNDDEIKRFVESNVESSQLSIVYNPGNKSALHTALSAGKYQVFLYLKEEGFKGKDADTLRKVLSSENFEKLKVKDDLDMAVHSLAASSKIFNSENNSEQRDRIKAWLTAISKTKYGKPLIKAAAQCEELQIVFDFERDDVAGVDLDSLNAAGIMYPHHKLVIVGAKISSSNNEQWIKGTIAHELAHYVIGMIFQNDEQPYFNESDPRCQNFKEIVEKYSYLKEEYEDDGCDEIISLVYRCYEEENWDAELIVRMFEIEAHFDDQDERVNYARRRFKDLDKFTENEVIGLMHKLNLKAMEYTNIFNKCTEFWSKTYCLNLQLGPSEKLNNILEKKLTVVTSNVPKLFLIEIYNHLKQTHGNFVNTKSVFVTQKKLNGRDFLEAFKLIMNLRMEINLILDFSSGDCRSLQTIVFPADKNIVIVVRNESQSEKIFQVIEILNHSQSRLIINYEWNKLDNSMRDQLLKRKVNFQGNQNVSLLDILGSDGNSSTIFDADILNLILSGEEIQINSDIGLVADKFFKYLFHWRALRDRYETCLEEVSQQELIDENKAETFVLISDMAGSGKSWAMRSLAQTLSKSTNWVTFVDLKQFTKYFTNISKDVNICNFIIDEVLKEKENLEKKIFEWKYRKGEVKIFFDGFDEIAPNCVEFVLKLIKSFEQNGKNQLYVSTRNFFKIQLEEELDVIWTYKLGYFSENEGIRLIATIWRLKDFTDLTDIDPQKDITESKEYEKYEKLARELIGELPNFRSIALPQIYSIIAKITAKKKELDDDLNTYQLYKTMWDENYEEWYKHKGILRENVHKESQYKALNSALHLHELKAMQKFAPGKSEYCGIDPNDEWKEEELEGCGLMSKKWGREFHFNHETFSEFFVAEFIIRNLKSKKTAEEVFEYMRQVIFDEKHEVIRKFLDDALEKEKKEDKEKWIETLAEGLQKDMMNVGNFCKVFADHLLRLDSLGSFFLEILKKQNYERFIICFVEGIEEYAALENEDDDEEFSQSSDEDAQLQKYQETFVKLITSCIDIQTLYEIVKMFNKEKKSSTFFKEVLNYISEEGENIIWRLTELHIFKHDKYEKFVESLRGFMPKSEKLIDKVKAKNKKGNTIVHHGMVLKTANWTEFYESFWNFIVETFDDDRVGLMEFILEPNLEKITFIQFTVDSERLSRSYRPKYKNDYFERSKIVSSQLERTFDKSERQQLLKLKPNQDDSLLFYFALSYFEPSFVNIFWNFLRNSVESTEEFLELLSTESDFHGNNLLLLINFRYPYAKEKMETYFENGSDKKLLEKEIKKHLYESNKMGQNILQFSALFIDIVDSCKVYSCKKFWEFVKENFSPVEIVKLLNQRDIFGYNLLQICILKRNKEVAEFMAKEIIDQIIASSLHDDELIAKLKEAVDAKLMDKANAEQDLILSLDWLRRDYDVSHRQPANDTLKRLLYKDFYSDENLSHRILNQIHSEYVESILKSVMAEGDVKMLKSLLKSTNFHYGQNFLQALVTKGISGHFYAKLLEFIQNIFDPDSYRIVLERKNIRGQDFLMTVAKCGTREIAEITWNQVEKIRFDERILQAASSTENCTLVFFLEKYKTIPFLASKIPEFVTKIIDTCFENVDRTILFFHTKCEDEECHKALWKIISDAFDDESSLFNFVTQLTSSNNFIYRLVTHNKSSKVISFIFETLKEKLNDTQFKEIIMPGNKKFLFHHALNYSKNVEIVKIVWELFRSLDHSSNFIIEVDRYGKTILNNLALNPVLEVTKFVCDELKHETRMKEVILKRDHSSRNFLMDAAVRNHNKECHECLWNFARECLDGKELFTLADDTDEYDKQNVFQLAVKWNTTDVAQFIWSQLSKKQQIHNLKLKNDLIKSASSNFKGAKEEMVEFVKGLKI